MMKNKYARNIKLNKTDLTKKLFDSPEFKNEDISTYGDQLYMKASIHQVFIQKLENGEIEFSENRGLNGPLEIIGRCRFKELNEKKTRLNVVFKIGVYNPEILTILLLVFSTSGLLMLFINITTGLFLFFLTVIVSIIIWSKNITIRSFIKKIEVAIGKENFD